MPPQETGLTCNSWYGKFHLEMHWWHSVHFALWNRAPLLAKVDAPVDALRTLAATVIAGRIAAHNQIGDLPSPDIQAGREAHGAGDQERQHRGVGEGLGDAGLPPVGDRLAAAGAALREDAVDLLHSQALDRVVLVDEHRERIRFIACRQEGGAGLARARASRAERINILAPIPGKAVEFQTFSDADPTMAAIAVTIYLSYRFAETIELLATIERGASTLPARRAVVPTSLIRPPRLVGRAAQVAQRAVEEPEHDLGEERDHACDDHGDHQHAHVAVADVGELVAEHGLDLLVVERGEKPGAAPTLRVVAGG